MRWRSPVPNLEEWHRFYPWFPRRIGDELVCFQWIERILNYSYDDFNPQYRFIENKD